MLKKDKKIEIQNIGTVINFDDYIPTNPNKFYNTSRKTYKMAGGVGGIAMHYIGMGMMAGVFIGGITSGIQGSGSVKGKCKELDKLSDQINDIQTFQTNEMVKRQQIAQSIQQFDYEQISRKISGIQRQIIDDNKKFKQMSQMNHIVNMVFVISFIIIIIGKVIIARSS
jgi:hypothetical protein